MINFIMLISFIFISHLRPLKGHGGMGQSLAASKKTRLFTANRVVRLWEEEY